MIGTQLGHYRIQRLLGRGGMGEVYLADDTKLKRRVAIKTVSPDVANDPANRRRLTREAQAVAALNHPNIVTVHAVEEVDGTTFIVLEYVDGEAMSALIPSGGMDLGRILTLMIPVADAAGAAHRARITHRDLKPSNVMVASDGQVKVLDFGLSTSEPHPLQDAGAASTVTHHPAGVLAGTYAYMSPEQVSGQSADARSDVFALGVMLYEMATGSRPFAGDTTVAVLSSILKDPVAPLRDRRSDLPPEFDRIVQRCLSKRPDDRYQTATDLRNDLRDLFTARESHGVSAAVRWGRTAAMVAAVTIAITLAGAVAFWPWLRPENPPPFANVSVSSLPIVWAGTPAISPDGSELAYVPIPTDPPRIVLRTLRDGAERTLLPLQNSHFLAAAFSPDGRDLYIVTSGEFSGAVGVLSRVSTGSGSAVHVLDQVLSAPAFAPDGARMAVLRRESPTSTALTIARIDGANPTVLARLPARCAESVSWSSTGRIATMTERPDGCAIVIVNPESGHQNALAPSFAATGQVAWLAGGESLLVGAVLPGRARGRGLPAQLYRVSVRSGRLEPLTPATGELREFAIAGENATTIYIRNSAMKMATWLTTMAPRLSRPLGLAPDASNRLMVPALTPDGQILQPLVSGNDIHIWRTSIDGSARVQLTSDPGEQMYPRVSPSGRRLLFARTAADSSSLWVADGDGRGAMKIRDGIAIDPVFAQNEDAIYYGVGRRVERLAFLGGTVETVFDAEKLKVPLMGSASPKPSPDGKWVAALIDRAGAPSLELLPLDGSNVARRFRLPAGQLNWAGSFWYVALWTADSRSLVYVRSREIPAVGAIGIPAEISIWRLPIDGEPPELLDRFSGEQLFDLSMTPDARQLLVTRGMAVQQTLVVTDAGVRRD